MVVNFYLEQWMSVPMDPHTDLVSPKAGPSPPSPAFPNQLHLLSPFFLPPLPGLTGFSMTAASSDMWPWASSAVGSLST